jgi:hypothetical protein
MGLAPCECPYRALLVFAVASCLAANPAYAAMPSGRIHLLSPQHDLYNTAQYPIKAAFDFNLTDLHYALYHICCFPLIQLAPRFRFLAKYTSFALAM